MHPPSELSAAMAQHHAGAWAEAERGYRRILRRKPGYGVVLHLLGVLAYQTGRPAEAVQLIGRAIAGAGHRLPLRRRRGAIWDWHCRRKGG